MKRIWKKVCLMALLWALSCLLGGCLSSSTVEELFTLPQPPIEYTELAAKIDQLISDGYEYASPTGGENIQSVQMVDLDQDGQDEAIAFFRRDSDEKPLKIMVFQSRDDTYEWLCTIESSGTAVDSVQYRDMNGDGVQEIIVGWKISADVQNVAVYTVGRNPVLLLQNAYTRYSIQTLDPGSGPGLLLFRSDSEGNSIAEFYGWQTESMTLLYRSVLSSSMAELTAGSIVTGMLTQNAPAVFVTGVDEQGMAVTDILVCREGGTLTNAALNWSTGISGLIYPYFRLQPQDINGDGITEIPAPMAPDSTGKQTDGLVEWLQCDFDGNTKRVATTYHNISSGWYFILPAAWKGPITATVTQSIPDENQVVLFADGEPMAALYTITGENRENRAMRGNRVVLRRQTDVVYAGELLSGSKATDFDESDLRSCFQLIVSSWTGG